MTEFGETSEAIFLNSAYTFESAEHAEKRFAKEIPGYFYSRYSNPSLDMLEQRLAQLEGAERCLVVASGMAAVFAAIMSVVKSGDHVVAGKVLFSSCNYIITQILPKFGISYTLVDGVDMAAAIKPNTTAIFIETPANPTLEVIDIEALAKVTKPKGIKLIVDNIFAGPLIQKPLELGADIVVYSTTKHMEGQGRTIGGAILGAKDLIENTVLPFCRHTGPHMSPFNAWVIFKGLETYSLRIARHVENAEAVVELLANNPKVTRVIYPGLKTHPQYAIAYKQMKNGGPMLAFELNGGKEAAFKFMNALKMIRISNNLGDAKSLITHCASSTHASIAKEERAKLGISEGLIRLSPGIEDKRDILDDIARGLAAV